MRKTTFLSVIFLFLLLALQISVLHAKEPKQNPFKKYYIYCNYANSCKVKIEGLEGIQITWNGNTSGGSLVNVKLPISNEEMKKISQEVDVAVSKVEAFLSKFKDAKGKVSQSFLSSSKNYSVAYLQFVADNDFLAKIEDSLAKKWIYAAVAINCANKIGKLPQHFYFSLLHSRLKDIPDYELELFVANSKENDKDALMIANYLYLSRDVTRFSSDTRTDLIKLAQAFYQNDLLKGYEIHPDGAFYRWISDKKGLNWLALSKLHFFESHTEGCSLPPEQASFRWEDCSVIEKFKQEIESLKERKVTSKP